MHDFFGSEVVAGGYASVVKGGRHTIVQIHSIGQDEAVVVPVQVRQSNVNGKRRGPKPKLVSKSSEELIMAPSGFVLLDEDAPELAESDDSLTFVASDGERYEVN